MYFVTDIKYVNMTLYDTTQETAPHLEEHWAEYFMGKIPNDG